MVVVDDAQNLRELPWCFGNDPGILEMLTSTASMIMLMLRMGILYILYKGGAWKRGGTQQDTQ
jgi:hypothetical protein